MLRRRLLDSLKLALAAFAYATCATPSIANTPIDGFPNKTATKRTGFGAGLGPAFQIWPQYSPKISKQHNNNL